MRVKSAAKPYFDIKPHSKSIKEDKNDMKIMKISKEIDELNSPARKWKV
jgi:hypothetical protein